MSSKELKELKKTLLNRVVKVPKSYWNDGECKASEELDQNVNGIIIAVRKSKRKKQPIVIDVKISPYDEYEESICEMSVDHVMKMLQPVTQDDSSNKMEKESSSSSSNDSMPLSQAIKVNRKTNEITQDESQTIFASNEMAVESSSDDSAPLSNMRKITNKILATIIPCRPFKHK